MPILVVVYVLAVPMGIANMYTNIRIGICDLKAMVAPWSPARGVPVLVVVHIYFYI
jgi:hypothetical protein